MILSYIYAPFYPSQPSRAWSSPSVSSNLMDKMLNVCPIRTFFWLTLEIQAFGWIPGEISGEFCPTVAFSLLLSHCVKSRIQWPQSQDELQTCRRWPHKKGGGEFLRGQTNQRSKSKTKSSRRSKIIPKELYSNTLYHTEEAFLCLPSEINN